MVKYEAETLDRIFTALADPTRRAIVARLADGRATSIGAIAEPFAITLPGVMKHLRVLTDAGLVVQRKTGRTMQCRLEVKPMREAIGWLERYEKFWSERLESLAAFVEETQCPSPPSRASRSSGTSKRPSRKSSRR